MSNNYRVLNLTTGEHTKYKQALKRIEECLWAWVDVGKTVRTLTLKEQLVTKAEQNRLRSPIAAAEVPLVKFIPPATAAKYCSEHRRFIADTRKWAELKVEGKEQDFAMIRAANQYAQEATA